MRVVFDRRARQLEIKKWLKDAKSNVDNQAHELRAVATRERRILLERLVGQLVKMVVPQ
jgi:hypothetical protein